MKGKEQEESDEQALGSWSGALGARFFRVAFNFICVGVASMTRLYGRRYGGEYAGATGRKVSLGAGGRDFLDRTENSMPGRFRENQACSTQLREEKKGVECTGG